MSARAQWFIFLLITALLGVVYGVRPFLWDKDARKAHLPGETSPGHHQLEESCETCHSPFGGVMNDACTKCHGDELSAENDSHPVTKFADPRNADRAVAAGFDPQQCVTCHREHVPDRTVAGVTIADDFCAKCHQEVFQDRPSHSGSGLSRSACGSSGCHNYHDNRALYEDFLKKHLNEPELSSPAKVAARYVPKDTNVLLRTSIDLTEENKKALFDEDKSLAAKWDALLAEWEDSAHAKSGINCTGCHRVNDPAIGGDRWETKVARAKCAECHVSENEGFLKGKHGMRVAAGLSPMTPAMALLPMTPEARGKELTFQDRLGQVFGKIPEGKHEELGCTSCHRAHTFASRDSAVEACLGCHADEHSRNYKASRHFERWEWERAGKAEEGTGVSCATCHMPREEHKEGAEAHARVQHNQNDNLRPSDKMLRSVCMNCHGLGFSMDALADRGLVTRNFNGRPTRGSHVESLDWVKRRLGEKSKKGD